MKLLELITVKDYCIFLLIKGQYWLEYKIFTGKYFKPSQKKKYLTPLFTTYNTEQLKNNDIIIIIIILQLFPNFCSNYKKHLKTQKMKVL